MEKEKKDEISQSLEKCEKEKEEYLSGWKRQKADFLNYQKDEAKRMERAIFYSKVGIFLKILDIFDHLILAKEHLEEDKVNDWQKGILQIISQTEKFLQEQGIEEVKTKGEMFDPTFHEAVGQVEEKGESGIIIEVIQKGYLLDGQLLRPAKVKVIK